MKNIIFLFLLLGGNMTYAQDAWRKIGDIAPESGFNSYPSIAIDSNNVPYVAYADLGLFGTGTDFGVTVKKFNGTSWQFVGQRAFSGTTEVASTEIAINHQNIPYVVYSMQPVGSNYVLFRLDKYNGLGWDNLIQRTGVIGDRNALTIDRNNNPLFSYISNRNTFAMEINTLGPIAGFNNSLVGFYADFAVDNNNTIYVAYRGAGNSNLACVQRFNGTTWEFVGPSTGISANRTSSTRIVIDHNNVPYIAYRDDIRETIDVQKFNGTNWELVGSAGFPGKAEMPDIAFDNNNVPYVSYNDFLNGLQSNPHYLGVSVQKFNGTAWELVGQRTFSTINAISFGTQIVFGKNNVPYVTTNARVGSSWKAEAYYFGPPTFPPITLPIRLLSFEAKAEQEAVVINWSTVTETNNDFFTIERSHDGMSFIEVSRINAAGNSNNTLQYTYTDAYPFSGRSYYRLKQTDYDGRYTYSDIRTVTIQNNQQVQVFPNGTGSFTISIAKPTRTMQIEIYDLAGMLVYKTVTVGQINTISLQSQAKGLYIIKVVDGKELVALQKVIK